MATGRIPTTANSPLTVKGDLFGYSTTQARVPVGNNGETLVADSSTSTGLRYNPQNALANPVINGGFDIAQRGTSIAIGAVANGYTLDRWFYGTGANQASTISQQATGDTTNLPNIQSCVRVQRNSGQTGAGATGFDTSIETRNSIPYAGKTVTVSFYARAGANYSPTSSFLNINLVSGTGTDQSVSFGYTGSSTLINQNATLTTTWQRFAWTGTVPANATELGVRFIASWTGTAGAADFYEVTGVQLDLGTYVAATAPTFRRAGGTIQGELAACQRYYYRQTSGDNSNVAMGAQYSTTEINTIVPFAVTMRVNPSAIVGSGTDYYRFYRNGTFDGFNSLTRDANFSSSGAINSIKLYNSSEISGTAGHSGIIVTANASASVAFDAEL